MTLQEQLKSTPGLVNVVCQDVCHVCAVDGTVDEQMLAYNRANRDVAILCNHQRAPPKSHEQQVEKIDAELEQLRSDIKELKKDYKQIKSEVSMTYLSLTRDSRRCAPLDFAECRVCWNLQKLKTDSHRHIFRDKKVEIAKNKLERAEQRLHKKEINRTDKEENKTIALSTSKLNYLDPRISVAWCKKHGVPIEKVGAPLAFPIQNSLLVGVQPHAAQEVPVGDRDDRDRLRVLSSSVLFAKTKRISKFKKRLVR